MKPVSDDTRIEEKAQFTVLVVRGKSRGRHADHPHIGDHDAFGGMPLVGAQSEDEGTADCGALSPENITDIRQQLEDLREMFAPAVPATLRAKTFRMWCTQQAKQLRKLVDRAAAVAERRGPACKRGRFFAGEPAIELARAAIYSDVINNWDRDRDPADRDSD
jgi:hypothetical protein